MILVFDVMHAISLYLQLRFSSDIRINKLKKKKNKCQ